MRFRKYRICSLLGIILIIVGTSLVYPQEELRGLWIPRWAISNPDNIKTIVEKAARYHFNALFVQVRGEADAYYKTHLEPRAEDLANQDPEFDPLQMVLDLAHPKGLQVHAWVNVYPVWSGAKKNLPKSAEHIYRAHPDWLMVEKSGSRMDAKRFYNFLSPGHPEVQEHLSRVFYALVNDYEIDGLHLDHFRYPDKGEVPGEYSYDQPSLTRFFMLYNRTPEQRPVEWQQWQCDQITGLLKRIYFETTKAKPDLVISVAVKPNPDWAKRDNKQDWTNWLSLGIADYLIPMIYHTHTDIVYRYIQTALKYTGNRYVFPGLRAYGFSEEDYPISRLVQHIYLTREFGTKGIVLYAYDDLAKNNDAGFNALLAGPFKEPAVVPDLPWKKR
ncbi:MAG: family 10 glycosylhydrolase [bacterium]|nr:family 10 glycosylhydrolase [bacterium]